MPSFGKTLALIFSFLLVSTNLFLIRSSFAQQPSFTTPPVYQITAGIPSASTPPRLTFFFREFDLDYKGGKVIFSSNPDGTGDTRVDDAVLLNIRKPNGTWQAFNHSYTTSCNPLVPLPPKDVSYLFEVGVNRVQTVLRDICGAYKSSTPLYLVTEDLTPSPTPTPTPIPSPSPSGPEPFLDLPWDYGANGMTFNDSATSINSYFDHEYPLLSSGLSEPDKVISYSGGTPNAELDYSSHDGYDYGTPAEVNLGKPVLAAAAGTASFMSSCAACGNAILIDHGNGYQTRYYHLQKDGLVKSTPGETIEVTRGEQIGKVGFSGNVSPAGEKGSHLHFMVIQDKNNDGNFEDNIPDGIIDPFGWQSTEPDPWETYSFNYAGQERTGNKSYYLFIKQLDNLNANLDSNAKVFNVGKTKFDFPEGATDQNLNLNAKSAPNFTDPLGLNSLGSIINFEAKNAAGKIITTFLKNFSLTINFSQFDLSRYNIDTLSIYSSPDGQNWTKENTSVDLNNKTAATSINHLTYFALMAERKDTVAPTTTPVLEGEKGTGNNFHSDVKVNLNAIDNPGGLGVEFSAYRIGDEDWQTYTSPLHFANEGNYEITFYSQDNDGNVEEIKSVEFSIDKIPPVISAKASAQGNEYIPGTWVNENVTVSFSCTDSFSGVESITEPKVINTEGKNQEAKGVCEDKAGNISEITFSGINIDKTAPVIKISADPNILWPPDNKMTDVKLNGEILEPNLRSNTINIEDEYDLVEPPINDLNQVIKLESSRKGDDPDGRVYTIKVLSEDLAGNSSEGGTKIIVPHDQSK